MNMNWLKKMVHITMTLMIMTASTASYSTEVVKTDPYEMMKVVSENLFARLEAENSHIRENPETLKVVVEEELMPFIDYRYASLKVLGRYLKKEKNRDNVKAFIDAFRIYLVSSYAQVLTLYKDQTVQFELKNRVDPSKRIIGIKVNIIDRPKPDITLEFKLRKNKKTGEWLAFDMVAEGISLLSSKQSEWSSKIRKEGLPSVSKELIELSRRPIRFEGESK